MALASVDNCTKESIISPRFRVVQVMFMNSLDNRSAVLCAANRVKPLFRLDQPLLHQALFGLQHASEAQLQGICNRHLSSPWAGIVTQHIFAMSKRNLGQRPDQAYSIYTAQEGPAKGALNALSENPQVSALHTQQLMAAAVSCCQAKTPLVHSSVNGKPHMPTFKPSFGGCFCCYHV